MFRNMESKDLNYAYEMIGRINCNARKIFEQAYDNGNLINSFVFESEENKGIFTIVEGDDYYSLQLSFEKDVSDYVIIKFIHDELNKIIENREEKDVYLNINGYNSLIINYFRNYGFLQDSLGFELWYKVTDEKLERIKNFKLIDYLRVKEFEEENVYKYFELLDDAFRNQNIECNEETDVYKNLSQKDIDWLKRVNTRGDFKAFWNGDNLIGLYILNNKCLDTLAVNPEYEGNGYGNQILKHCLKYMMLDKEYNEIYLRVYYSNKKAQKLYIKSGFEMRGFYCENTYNQQNK